MTGYKKLAALLGLSATLAISAAIAKPPNGSLGVYLDSSGHVVGTFSVGCDGTFSYQGTRTANAIVNGHFECNGP